MFDFRFLHVGLGHLDSLRRYEYYLAARLGLRPGMRALDAGCGVGGPLRNMARFSGARVTGVTISPYQVRLANQFLAREHLDKDAHGRPNCHVELGDFMNLRQFADGEFDAVYAIEATCHAGDRERCYRELARVAKPGAIVALYEWVLTDLFDAKNSAHWKAREDIKIGSGLPNVLTARACCDAFAASGLDVLEVRDLVHDDEIVHVSRVPWYHQLSHPVSLQGLAASRFGRTILHRLLSVLETLRLAPHGTVASHDVLIQAADGLVAGGEMKIFTPCYLMVGRKPSHDQWRARCAEIDGTLASQAAVNLKASSSSSQRQN